CPLRAVQPARRSRGDHPLGGGRRMVADEPAEQLPQRNLRRREGVPAAGAAVARPGQAPADARTALPVPGAGLRGPLPGAAPRHGRAGGGARRTLPTDPPTARGCAARAVAPLGRARRRAATPAAQSAGLEAGPGQLRAAGRAVCDPRLAAGDAARRAAAALSAGGQSGDYHAVRDQVTWTSSNTRLAPAVSWRAPGSGACC